MDSKVCLTCKEELPVDSFYTRKYSKDSDSVPFGECKTCANVRATKNRKSRRAKKPKEFYEKERNYGKKHYAANRDVYRNQNLKSLYGITLEDWYRMYEEQDGKCDICQKDFPKERQRCNSKSLAVDHCHDTGRVRSLLCVNCNMAIGGLRHDESLVKKALAYLVKHK